MNKTLFPIFALILAACAPQVTVTSEATSTAAPTLPPPTATIVPTPAISPEFLDLQTQVDGSGTTLTLGSDGVFEQQMPDGTYQDITGIHVNPITNQIEIMVNGAPVIIDRSQISFEGGVLKIEGYSYDSANSDFDQLVEYDAATWESMVADGTNMEALAKLPETMVVTIDEQEVTLTKGSFSTVKDNVVRYEDATKRVVQGYDVLTGEYKNALDAGIHDIPLNDGTYYEVLGFHTEEEALYYMAEVDGAWGTYKERKLDPNFESFVHIYYQLIGFSQFASVQYHTNQAGESFFVEKVDEAVGTGVQFNYLNRDNLLCKVYVGKRSRNYSPNH